MHSSKLHVADTRAAAYPTVDKADLQISFQTLVGGVLVVFAGKAGESQSWHANLLKP